MTIKKRRELNLRDLGGIALPGGMGFVPEGRYLRSGKLSVLSSEECEALCREWHIKCVIDLRSPIETQEFPDPLPQSVSYVNLPLLKDATIGISHETGSDPMTIIRSLRKHPEKLQEMVPDFSSLYRRIVTEPYSLSQLRKALLLLRRNEAKGWCTLFHCTAGKDRTGILSMALLKSYGVADEEIVHDYLRTNRNAFLPTVKKCIGVALLTHNWPLVKTAYRSFMAQRAMIETAINNYKPSPLEDDIMDDDGLF